MIVVDPDLPDTEAHTDAASINTLVTAPKFPRYFPTLAYLSLAVSTSALACSVATSRHLLARRHANSLVIIFAFALALPYQLGAVLLVWLEHHQIASLLAFAPASRRSLAYGAFLALLWAGAAAASGWAVDARLHWYGHKGCAGAAAVRCAVPPHEDRGVRPRELTATALALALSIAEMGIFGATTLLCYLHRRAKYGAAETPRTLELGPLRRAGVKAPHLSA